MLGLLATACSTDIGNAGGDDGQPPSPPTGEGDGGSSDGGDNGGRRGSTVVNATLASFSDEPETEVTITLGEGDGGATPQPPTNTTVDGTPLEPGRVDAILAQLPSLIAEETDQVEFRRPPESLPPPRPGTPISETFPAAPDSSAPPAVDGGPLEVLRFQPEGPVEVAPFVSVTFNQPMVPLSTLDQLDQLSVPATISPELPGRWEWIGTKTLRFEFDGEVDRIPGSTTYTVTVPAGTQGLEGGELASEASWQFTTNPIAVTYFTAFGQVLDADPIFFVRFDQRMVPADVLAQTTVSVSGSPVALRLATDDEIAADDKVQRLVDGSLEERFMVFKAAEPLALASSVQVVIGPNTPSAEGPLTPGQQILNEQLETYAPLRLVATECGYDGDCRPFQPFEFEFNNDLDPATFDPSTIVIEPELPGARATVNGRWLRIEGPTVGRTDYNVTIPAGLVSDVFGQLLTEEVSETFRVGDAQPGFARLDSFVTVDPFAEGAPLSLYSINVDSFDIAVYKVDAGDWQTYDDDGWKLIEGEPDAPQWQLVSERTVQSGGDPNAFTETIVDLEPEFSEHGSHLVVIFTPDGYRPNRNNNEVYPSMSWVQSTDIGLDVFVTGQEVVAWTTDLATGEPLPGVEILVNGAAIGTTGESGLLEVDRSAVAGQPDNKSVVSARLGADTALVPNERILRDRSGPNSFQGWFVFDDRGIYRPGETASIKGWVRRYTRDTRTQPDIASGDIAYALIGPQGNEIATGSTNLSAAGGFDLTLDIPVGTNLGYAELVLTSNGASAGHVFRIEEFRTPEFEVSAEVTSAEPHMLPGVVTAAVEATYFSGGPLPGAEVIWDVSTNASNYAPPGWSDYVFGERIPWWWFSDGPDGGNAFASYNSITEADGRHSLAIDVAAEGSPRPLSVVATASVVDVNRQVWSAVTTALVHPAETYVGLRSERPFVRKGEPIDVAAVAVDIDGVAEAGRNIVVEAARLDWEYNGGEWTEVQLDPQRCEVTSADTEVLCSFDTPEGGRYRITAVVTDDAGRMNQTVISRWVSGGSRPPGRDIEREDVLIIPSAEEYAPGDVAELLVQSPFVPATGVMIIARDGIEYTEAFSVTEDTHVLTVPIDDTHIPNVHVQIELVGSAPRLADDGTPAVDAPARPAFAGGEIQLPVSRTSRVLTVDVTAAPDTLSPGGTTQVDVQVVGPDGQPVGGAEVAVVAVDEAVLALTDYQLGDPVGSFYPNVGAGVTRAFARTHVQLANLDVFSGGDEGRGRGDVVASQRSVGADGDDAAMEESADFAGAPAPEGAQAVAQGPAINLRSNFDPLAVFAPETITDASGRATVTVELPDNLTRYRIMVVAADSGGTRFGTGESSMTARLPLMVRPSAPRFLNFGDKVQLPVVIQNQTDEPMAVEVAIRATNLDLTDGAGRIVDVPANDRIEVRFPADAVQAGTARFQVAAVSGDLTDAAEIDLPVYTPATAEAFATYGVVDEGTIGQPILAPEGVFPQFGGLDISTSSTAISALTDAFLYLQDYSYDSSDAYASRILATVALRDVLEAFEAPDLPTPAEIDNRIAQDIEALRSMQNWDGGFPFWQRGRDSIPWNSIQVSHALVLARQEGYEVPDQLSANAIEYLVNIESYYPSWYSTETRTYLSSYAQYVLNLAGLGDPSLAQDLFGRPGADRLDVLAWLWPVIEDQDTRDEIERQISNAVTETAGAATFTTSVSEQDYVILRSDRRTDAIVLDAVIGEARESDLIPKVVAGLLGHQVGGRWNNVQENSFVLLSLKRYFDEFEDQTPDFVARVWLGDIYAAEHEYQGRTTDQRSTGVTMAELLAQPQPDLVVSKDGPGRLYYRLGLRYAPDDLVLEARDRGFVVERTYEAIDDPDDVVRLDDGTWQIKPGAEVRVRVTMVADSRRTHVALIDPLPAGLEIVNPTLAVSATPQADPSERGWDWWWRWYDHQNQRDDRAEAFTSYLWAGTYDYSYVARATTPGEFVVPPARAEEMYSPETFGRSASDRVVIG